MVSLRTLTLVSIYQAVVAVLAMALTGWLWPKLTLGVLAGAALMGSNFWAMRVLAHRASLGGKARLGVLVALGTKFALALAILAFFVLVLHIEIVGLAVGLATLFVAIGFGTLHTVLAAREAP